MDLEPLRAVVRRIDSRAQVTMSACGEGTMPLRCWPGPAGAERPAPVVLLHGGSGSWTHWIRNIEALAGITDVIVPDLPGLGDAAALPREATAHDVSGWLRRAVERVDSAMDEGFHLVAFSWGCIPAAIMASANPCVRSVMLIGPAGFGRMPEPGAMQPLLRRSADMTPEEVYAANRENLARLMIHDRNCIDDLAVYLQTVNTSRSRFNSPPFARTSLVLDHLPQIDAPLAFVYGDEDTTAKPNIGYRQTLIQQVRPDAVFNVYAGVGHWVQYEASERFNAQLAQWLGAS